MNLISRFLLIMVTTSLFLGGCRSEREQPAPITKLQTSPIPSPEPKPRNDPGQSIVECIEAIPFLEKTERSGLLKTWKKVPGYKNYRMVEASDFRIPGWVSREYYARDVERATAWSHDYGELGGAYGLVLFVVDRTTVDNDRFSVAILIRRPGNKFSLYWVFEKTDLSRVTLNRHSGDVYLQEFREDGTTRSCDIQWSRNLGRWACQLD